MLSFKEITDTLFSRGIEFTIEEYIFCLNLVHGEDKYVSYALAYDPVGYKKVLGTENEDVFVQSKRQACDVILQTQNIVRLKQEMEDLYVAEIQSKAMNLKDYRFTGGQIAQILQNLLQNRISDLDSASTKDVIGLIKLLTERFGIEGGSDFDKHFIQIYPKYNALCIQCNREFECQSGIGVVCPHCGATYQWDVEMQRFIPEPIKL